MVGGDDPIGVPVDIIARVGIQRRSILTRDKQKLGKVAQGLAKELATLKRGLMYPYKFPKEHPGNPVPLAANPYRAITKQRKRGPMVQPGRLRRITGMGLVYSTGAKPNPLAARKVSNFPRFRHGMPVKIWWGIKVFPGNFINYARWIGQLAGSATGGGGRHQWYVRFRRWLYRRLRILVNKVNGDFNLVGRNQLTIKAG